MRLAFIEDGSITRYPIGLIDLRRKYPNVSFSTNLEGIDTDAYGVVQIQSVPSPSVDPLLQRVEEGEPAQVDGVWQQVWNVIDLTAAEIQAATDTKAAQVRGVRNDLLMASDWTQIPDAPVDTAAWTSYRAELRAVPEQPGFPYDVNWPTEPTA